jgi:hypothetical protein
MTAALPRCSGGVCSAAYACPGDLGPDADDGLALATVVPTPQADAAPIVMTGVICGAVSDESDYYRFEGLARTAYVVTLDSRGGAAADLEIFDATNRSTNLQATRHGFDRYLVTPFPGGANATYFARVHRPAGTEAAPTPYTLTFEAASCRDDAECANGTSCFSGVCDVLDLCVGDDADENASDLPAGAVTLAPAVGATVSRDAAMCNAPYEEADWYQFDVADGDDVTITVSWDGPAEFDVRVLDRLNRELTGASFQRQPEVIELTYLPAGTYEIHVARDWVFQVSTDQTLEAVPYRISVNRRASSGCTSSKQCDDAFATQAFRGRCDTNRGACVPIEGPVETGGTCDGDDDYTPDDCATGGCIRGEFASNASRMNFCTIVCEKTSQCQTMIGADTVCHPPFDEGDPSFCARPCTANTDCGWSGSFSDPDPGQAWGYLRCDTKTGFCSAAPEDRARR